MLFLIGQEYYSLAIVQLHALSLLQKTFQIRDLIWTQYPTYMEHVDRALNYTMRKYFQVNKSVTSCSCH